MPLANIIALAKQQQEKELQEKSQLEELEKAKHQEEEDRQRAIKSEMLDLEAQKFKNLVYKYVGEILSELDSPANIEFRDGEFFCNFHVCHVLISISIKEKSLYYGHVLPVKWGILVEIADKSILSFRKFIDITWHFKPVVVEASDDIVKSLLKLILKISEEYKYFLEYKQTAQREKDEEQKVKTLLQEYREKIEVAATRSKQNIDKIVSDGKANLWRWPSDFRLKLFKITWTKGGFVDRTSSYRGEPHFEYDRGLAFSDVPDEFGYFYFLPERTGKRIKPARFLNPTDCVTKEIFYFTEDTLPTQLKELVLVEYNVVVLRGLPGRYPVQLLAAEFLEPPKEIPELSIERMKKHTRLGFEPCLEIKQAIDTIATNSNPVL
jgi:hypothetical protein